MQERLRDSIDIAGSYQFDALHSGFVVQRYWHQLKLQMIELMALPDKTMSVLDLGCGSGVVSNFLSAHALRVLGVDSNPAAVAFASCKYQQDNLVFVECPANSLNFEPASFDKIYLLEFIEHIYWAQNIALFEQLRNLLKPQGQLFITTPNYLSLWPFIEVAMDIAHLAPRMQDDQHVCKFTSGRLYSLAEASGFSILSQRRFAGMAPFVSIFGWNAAKVFERFEERLGCPLGNLLASVWRSR